MKYLLILITQISISLSTYAQSSEQCFQNNEFLEFKVKYMSFNTSTASLEIKEEKLNKHKVYHIIGKGKSSRLLGFFFKIKDRYETYINKETMLPEKFIRDIDEGGHTKNIEINFDQNANKAEVIDHKHKKTSIFVTENQVQDMVSAFYYLRSHLDVDSLKIGDETQLYLFFDNQNYNFKLRYLGSEDVKTKFGIVNCLKFRPLVMADRVFKEQESLTVWVSNDDNKIPVKIGAELMVGSLTAQLNRYRGLKYPLLIK